nr:caspase activity and apoptosis inhibitor 1-like [Lytechinus pictus]
MAEVKQDMLPDSTQGETPEQKKGTKRKGTKDGKKRKKVAKKKSKASGKSKTKSNHGSDADSDLDLSKEKQPLEFYLHDREQLINEAFKAVKGLQLTSMVPDILKYVPLDELKQLCLNQLEGMSRKRIEHVIHGTEMLFLQLGDSDINDNHDIDDNNNMCNA